MSSGWRRAVEVLAGALLVLAGVAIPRVLEHFAPVPANNVYWIVVHHAASGESPGDAGVPAGGTAGTAARLTNSSPTGTSEDIDWRAIDKMHRARGFDEIGYNYVVRLDGTIEKGRAEDARGAHAKAWDHRGISYNASSIGVCFAGNCDVAGWTLPQQERGYALLRELMRRYRVPPERVIGHNETGFNTHCPGELIDMDKVRARLKRELGGAKLEPLREEE